MITGFNTDVDYDGRVFHVQTEDKGRGNPVVESLVYAAGEIVTTRRTSYADLAQSAAYSEGEVLRRMESQHQALIREIRNGRFDPEGPKPFGYNIITNRALDEVVMDFLSVEGAVEPLRLEMESHTVLVEGARPTLHLRVFAGASERPVAGARVTVKLISTLEKPRELFAGATGADGRVAAALDIPAVPGANTAILCQAESGGNNAEIKQLIRKGQDPA